MLAACKPEVLRLTVESAHSEPSQVQRAAAALGRLAPGLRRLTIDRAADKMGDSAALLAEALPLLTSLSALEVRCSLDDGPPPPQLAAAPATLRELGLIGLQTAFEALRSAPLLGGLTKLSLAG